MKLRVYLEICSACNLKCKYCFEGDYTSCFVDTNSLFLFTDTIKEKIDDVVITGGEPFLHPDFFKIVEHYSEYANVIVTTNGTIIDSESLRDFLSRHSNVQIQFSLDAIDPEFVSNVRGKGVWDKIMSAFSELEEFQSQLCISSTLTFQTPQMIRDIYTFAIEHRVHCYFPSILPYGALSSNWASIMPTIEEYITLEDTLFEIIANDEAGIIHSNKLDILIGNVIGFEEKTSEKQAVIKIDSMGNILACPATDCRNKCGILGNIKSLKSIKDLETNIANHASCHSANIIADRCEKCEVQHYCRKTFCGNCIHLVAPNKEIVEYICDTYKHHYLNILKVFGEGI